ncbi:hypothetical protein H1R20_g10880, partial [Candolleomyces eurysporus]
MCFPLPDRAKPSRSSHRTGSAVHSTQRFWFNSIRHDETALPPPSGPSSGVCFLKYRTVTHLVVFKVERSEAIEGLPSTAVEASTVLNSLLSSDEICSYDAVVLVQQRGLHASDLRNLSPESSDLPRFLSSSSSSRTFQYLVNDDASSLLPSRGRNVAEECQSRLVQYSPGDAGIVLDHDLKHVINLELPALTESGAARKEEMQEQEQALADELSWLSKAFPNHLVVYSGVPVSALKARASSSILTAANDDLPEGGILKRYQLLTPGLISALLVVFFVLIPVLFVGINSLAGIQSPVKMDIPKGFNAQEKKNQ